MARKTINLNDLPKEYREQVQRKLGMEVIPAILASNLKLPIRSNDTPKKKNTKFNTLVNVAFYSVRKRLADADGVIGKYVLDAIVAAGILQDDRTEFVANVSHRQVKLRVHDSNNKPRRTTK